MVIPGLSENSSLLVRAAELLSGGGVSNTLFEGTIMVAALPSESIDSDEVTVAGLFLTD